MKSIGTHNYFVYITTNKSRKVLYTGVTNKLARRLKEHETEAKTAKQTFAGKYNCFHLVYFERYQFINQAIEREKIIKGWRRARKVALVKSMNPEWRTLNEEVGQV